MANFKFATQEEKDALKRRAELLKPKAPNVVATDRGWAQSRPNGTLELLVSFAGLDALLGDVAPDAELGEPIEVKIETPVEESTTSVNTIEIEDVVESPKKKGGRPKKVVEESKGE